MDPGCTPQRIFPVHPSDQIAQVAINLRPPYLSRFPTLDHLEASAMPPQDGFWLNDLSRTEEGRPELGHQNE
jgi:hypothetical protein